MHNKKTLGSKMILRFFVLEEEDQANIWKKDQSFHVIFTK